MAHDEEPRNYESDRINRELRAFTMMKAQIENINHKITTGYVEDLNVYELAVLVNGFDLFSRMVTSMAGPPKQ